MGLTGIVVEATFAALPIETSRCVVDTTRTADLDSLLAAMAEGDERYRYSVAWVDLLATGKHLGRSVLTRGDHATVVQVTGHRDPTGYGPRMLAAVPPGVPNLINHASVRAFNEMWFRKAPRRRQGEIQSITRFFHPLDGIAAWNRVYGRHGFLQYQFVVPFGAGGRAARRDRAGRPFRSRQLRRRAEAVRARQRRPAQLPDGRMDADGRPAGRRRRAERAPPRPRHRVLDAGGRHYLAKDSHTTPESIRRGYPRLSEWQEARHKADPGGLWISDIARRLELIG